MDRSVLQDQVWLDGYAVTATWLPAPFMPPSALTRQSSGICFCDGQIVLVKGKKMKTRHRAYAYITHQSRLLLFTQPDPKAGIQVPAGTVKAGEDPADAVLREAGEETGLTALRLVRFLAQDTRDMRDCGTEELQYRWFYHLVCEETPPEHWRHGEFDEAGTLVHPFDFFWAALPNGVPRLVANYDDMLPLLIESLSKVQP